MTVKIYLLNKLLLNLLFNGKKKKIFKLIIYLCISKIHYLFLFIKNYKIISK